MAIKLLNLTGEVSTYSTYKDDIYIKLTEDERKCVDEKLEEICLENGLLPLSSNKIHRQSKQEFKHIIGSNDKYPRTITSHSKFLAIS